MNAKLVTKFSPLRSLYLLSVPFVYEKIDEKKTALYVICDTADTSDCGWETMVFAANKEGKVVDWHDLACRREMDKLDHKFVLLDMGYRLES
jgi:hypothetical protein